MTARLTIENLSYTYPGRAEPALTGVEFILKAGGCICLSGPSGCGKTTLLKAIQGLLDDRSLEGRLILAGPEPVAGLVFQNVDTQLLCTTVGDEVAFAPQNMGLTESEVKARAKAALAAVDLAGLNERNVEELSAGQKQRVCLAAVLAMEPGLLLLDEPLAQLDEPGRKALVKTLARLKGAGHALLISEHNLGPLSGLVDGYAGLDGAGNWLGISTEPPVSPAPLPSAKPGLTFGQPVVRAKGLTLLGPAGPVLDGVDLELTSGRKVHLFGANGAGKSTLLGCLAGLLRPQGGSLEVDGCNSPRPEDLIGRAGFLFQNPQRQLFEESVEAEVGFTLKRLGLPKPELKARVAEALNLCRVAHLARRSPLALSWGEQHRVALATVLALKPRLLLCDEPLAGLDWEQRYHLLEVLSRSAADNGTAVVIASHDPLPVPDWADIGLVISGGRLGFAQ